MPSLIDKESDLRDISRMCDEYLPPGSMLAVQSEIQKIFARSTAALQGQIEESCLALILVFSGELDDYRARINKYWTPQMEMQYLGAKLFLFGWSFPFQNQPYEMKQTPTSRKLILHEAMRISTRMIHTFCNLGSSRKSIQPSTDPDNSPPAQVHQPTVAFFELNYAVITLYLFLSHFPSPSTSDIDLAFNHIRNAHTLLTRCAGDNEKHQWARMAFNIDLLGKWHASGRQLPPEVAIKSRMGASLFYDGMQKIAVLKAEQGGRSYAADLTQPLPDREKHRGRKASMNVGTDEKEGVDPAGAAAMKVSTVQPAGVQEGPEDQTGLWPGWDESIWGWDLGMLDPTQFDFDTAEMSAWQTQGDPRVFE